MWIHQREGSGQMEEALMPVLRSRATWTFALSSMPHAQLFVDVDLCGVRRRFAVVLNWPSTPHWCPLTDEMALRSLGAAAGDGRRCDGRSQVEEREDMP